MVFYFTSSSEQAWMPSDQTNGLAPTRDERSGIDCKVAWPELQITNIMIGDTVSTGGTNRTMYVLPHIIPPRTVNTCAF